MENVRVNRTKQILLFDDEIEAQQFIDEHNRGAAVPEYTITDAYNFSDLDRVFSDLLANGVYMPLPNAELWQRATSYHTQKLDEVSNYFSVSGLTDEEKRIVLTDYFNALRGNYNFIAPPSIMLSTIEKTQSYKTFFIDKYGLWQMLQQYADYYNILARYAEQVRNGGEETKYIFLNETTASDARLRAAAWALMNRYIRLLDFSGIPNEQLVEFANTARKFAQLYDYCSFYHLCKYAYLATPDELETIHTPQGFKPETLREIRETACKNNEATMAQAAEQFATIIDRETPPQEREQAQDEAERWSREVRLPVNYNRLCQRPIEVSTAEQVKVTTALRNYIEGWLNLPTNARFNKPGIVIDEYTIQKVIGGLSLLKADSPQVKPENGLYTYRLNISKFAEYCYGYGYDANNYQKEALLGGLAILNGLFLIVDRPVRIHKKKNGKGVYKTGGKTAINLIRLRQYDIEKDNTITNIIIDIVAGNLGGDLKPLGLGDLKQLRDEAKGVFQTRFNNIVVGMDNKKEDDILDDCAGYSDMLKYAETEDDIKATKEYIRKNKPAARKKVQKLFEHYKELGIIKTYTRKQNKAGEWVYKWKRGEDKPQDETAPDLFTQAEIMDAEQPDSQS